MTSTNKNQLPLFNSRTKANMIMVLLVIWAGGAWHLALWATSDGLGITEIGRTAAALFRFSPLEIEGVTVGPAWLVLAALGIAVVAPVGLLGLWASWRHRRRMREQSGMAQAKPLAKAMQPRVGNSIAPFMFLDNQPLATRSEDTGCTIAAARTGKTNYVAVNLVRDAVGPVIATSTKVDLLRLTAMRRSELGTVWLCDPEGVSGWEDRLHWNIVDGCERVKVATERARAMVSARPLDGKNSGFFQEAAVTVLRSYLHAAALGGHTMREVLAWSRDFELDRPYEILADHPDAATGWDLDLAKFCRAEARETVSSTDMSLSLVLAPLADPEILATVCPSPTGETFNPTSFVTSTDTLYLLSEGENGGAAPILTALFSSVITVAKQVSQRTQTGRLDPVLTVVGDEIANICPFEGLPSLMSDGGGRGIAVWIFAQAYAQLERRWGREGAAEIWANSAVKLILGGSSDDSFLEATSRLFGERQVSRTSKRYGHGDLDADLTLSTERERVLTVAEMRQMSEGEAALMYRNQPVALVRLKPFWERKDKAAIDAGDKWARALETAA